MDSGVCVCARACACGCVCARVCANTKTWILPAEKQIFSTQKRKMINRVKKSNNNI